MPTLYVLCGLPGSGKSTYAKELKERLDRIGTRVYIASSDNIREELFGDVNDQSHNSKVFTELYHRVNNLLKEDYNIIIDATNTTIKSRKFLLNSIKEPCRKSCIIFNIPIEECIRRDSRRAKCVGENVIRKFYKSFQVPFKEEGWDSFFYVGKTLEKQEIGNFLFEMYNFDQKTKWHKLTLDKHCLKVADNFSMKEEKNLCIGALLHDYGKLFTQTFSDDGEAHYYNHGSIGAYELLCRGFINLESLFYVNYHMFPFSWNNEKTIKKYTDLFGEAKVEKLLAFNSYDQEAEN